MLSGYIALDTLENRGGGSKRSFYLVLEEVKNLPLWGNPPISKCLDIKG